ncbi:MAG: hypothetical protein KGR16_06545 [Verrucomicrobia bacterium]|nr:hypothetical protein [Verrucomicrobiota bacterium]MDE3048023.1 hypothetical protein [Verrucomicrobiota bacterium]
MSITLDSIEEDLFDSAATRSKFVSALAHWHGRAISWDDFSTLQAKVQYKIMELINQGDLRSEQLMFKLAWMGTAPNERPLIEKQIAYLLRKSDHWEVREVNLFKDAKNAWKQGWKETKKLATQTWKATCEVASKTVEAVQEFWEEYHEEIVTGVIIAATVAAVTTLVICAGGAGTHAVIAGGAALIDSVNDSPPDKPAALPSQAPTICLGECVPSASADKLLEDIKNSYSPRCTPHFAEESIAPFIPHPFYPQLNPAILYNDDYIAKCYEQLGWQPPFAAPQIPERELPARTEPIPIPQELRPSPTGGEFVKFIEGKLAATKDPTYTDQFPKWPNHQQVVTSIEQALGSTQDTERYLREFWEKEHEFVAGTQAIEQFYQKTKPKSLTSIDYHNYASQLAVRKPPAPIADIPLLGYADQSTIHYHCGINNTFKSVVDAGLQLHNSLDAKFAVQPHLIHSNHLLTGLGLVQVEKFDDLAKDILAAGAALPQSLTWPDTNIAWPETILQSSHIQKSVDYEVATLSQIAQEILKSGQDNLKQVHVTFSNGGYVFREALKQLTPEERSTIIVIPIGTTALIDADLACKVYNVIGDKDWPSISCNGGISGIEAAQDKANIEVVIQNETEKVIGGHYFTQPDYQGKITEILMQKITKTYDIY